MRYWRLVLRWITSIDTFTTRTGPSYIFFPFPHFCWNEVILWIYILMALNVNEKIQIKNSIATIETCIWVCFYIYGIIPKSFTKKCFHTTKNEFSLCVSFCIIRPRLITLLLKIACIVIHSIYRSYNERTKKKRRVKWILFHRKAKKVVWWYWTWGAVHRFRMLWMWTDEREKASISDKTLR